MAARALMMQVGPAAVTLQAVAAQLGMSHANVLHHFGSVKGLHAALAHEMALQVATSVVGTVLQLRAEQAAPAEVIEAALCAFSTGGAGRLAAWLETTGNLRALRPFLSSISALLHRVSPSGNCGNDEKCEVRHDTLLLVTAAFGCALIGEDLHAAVGLPKGAITKMIAASLARRAPGLVSD